MKQAIAKLHKTKFKQLIADAHMIKKYDGGRTGSHTIGNDTSR